MHGPHCSTCRLLKCKGQSAPQARVAFHDLNTVRRNPHVLACPLCNTGHRLEGVLEPVAPWRSNIKPLCHSMCCTEFAARTLATAKAVLYNHYVTLTATSMGLLRWIDSQRCFYVADDRSCCGKGRSRHVETKVKKLKSNLPSLLRCRIYC